MKDNKLNFLLSALHPGNLITTLDAVKWLNQKNSETFHRIYQIPINELKQWDLVKNEKLAHKSGKFFSIEGIRVRTNWGNVSEWEQPIINQPEIGFLGIIAKSIGNVLHFLMQAKIEPGNINIIQLSPTLQATRSNYTQVHKGKAPLYLEYFNGQKKVQILLDQFQSEQGARFLKKRNRNIIIQIQDDHDIPVYENFIWLTLRQIKELMCYDNVVNMDTRTVISAIPYGKYTKQNIELLDTFSILFDKAVSKNYSSLLYSVLNSENSFHTNSEILSWITSRKYSCELDVEKVPLLETKNWEYDGNVITHVQKKYFSVIGVSVNIGNREVINWDQPMVKPAQEGILAFLIKKINNVYHFLVQAKVEPGNFDIIEMAPTVQCLTGNYRTGLNEYSVPFINDVIDASSDKIWFSALQSEEGGRFFQEQNLNTIIEVSDDFPVDVPENYCWLTLNQLISFASYNNYLNIGARSLLAAVKFTT